LFETAEIAEAHDRKARRIAAMETAMAIEPRLVRAFSRFLVLETAAAEMREKKRRPGRF
jgi:hypothetical protein